MIACVEPAIGPSITTKRERPAPKGSPGLSERSQSLPLGVVVRCQPGVTRWAKWVWRPVAVIPGAPPADWRELRREGETVDYHAATVDLTVWRTDTAAYRVALANDPPSVYAVLRPGSRPERPWEVFGVTASAFEAQDHGDSGEDLVEPVPMPAALVAWLSEFVQRHHVEQPFVKRKRDRVKVDGAQDGRGDPRVRPESDVYRSPDGRRKGQRH